MKKFLLFSCIGLVAFSCESFGARTKSGVSDKEEISPQKKKPSSERKINKVQKKVKFILPKEEDMYRPQIRKFPTKNLHRNTKRTFYNHPSSDWFKENVSRGLLIQEGRGNGPSPQILQVKFICKPKVRYQKSKNEDNAPPLRFSRGTTFWIPNGVEDIPNEEEALKKVFNSLEPNKPQSKLKKKDQK